jgi:hypothetical protein
MITNDLGRRVFCLQVAGLSYRYHSITPPASTNLDANIATGLAYTDVQGIISVGAFNSSIDPSGGLASYSPLSIELSINKDGSSSDPGIIFGRVGKRSSGVTQCNLDEVLNFDALPQTIDIDKDLSSLSTPRLIHIGSETFRASAFTSSTVTVDERAVGGSEYQYHAISLQGSSVPILSTEITIFRGRRCKLFIAYQDSAGNVSDYECIINGFIESSPSIEDGDAVALSILPLVSLIDSELADSKKGISYLLQDYHYFHNMSNTFEYGSAWDNDYYIELSNPVASVGQTTLDAEGFYLDQIFDINRPNGEGFINAHPRYPLIIIGRVDYVAFPISYSAGSPPTITIDHTVDGSVSQAALLNYFVGVDIVYGRIPKRGEIKRVTVGTHELKLWPECLNEALSTQVSTSSNTGIDGVNHALSFGGSYSSATLRATPLANHLALSPRHTPHDGKVHLWYSSYWYNSSPNYHYAHWPSDEIENTRPLRNTHRLFYPLDYWMDGSKPNYAGNSLKVRTIELPNRRYASEEIPVNIARAYHQANELGILLEQSLGLPTSSTPNVYFSIQVQTYDYYHKRTKTLHYQATHEEAVSYGGSVVGYLVRLRNFSVNKDNGHFGDWQGEDRTQVTRGVLAYQVTPGEIMLMILQSGGGGNNGDYDTLGVGLSIHEDNIDVNSFLINGTSTVGALNTNFSIDDFNPRDFMDSLLKSLGCMITMKRTAGGLPKITLSPLASENDKFVSATIDAGDFLSDRPPTWSIYEDIVTQIEIKYGWDNDENEFKDSVIYNNQDAINRYGGEKSKISLELYGVSIEEIGGGAGDAYNYFLPIAARVFNVLSNPMRLWTGDIGTGKSIYLDVGSYVKCTSPHLKGMSDEYGITDEIGMIKSINQELMSEGCSLEIIKTGITSVNWNSTLKVTSVTSTTELTVSTNEFSDDDISFFSVGDVVDFLPYGNEDAAITGLKILTIVGSLVTFTSAHGVSTLGTLEPTVYTSASDAHKKDAYLADNGILGIADDAQEYN